MQIAAFHQVSASMNSTSSSNTYLFKNKNSSAALVGGSTQRFEFSTSNDAADGGASSFKTVEQPSVNARRPASAERTRSNNTEGGEINNMRR